MSEPNEYVDEVRDAAPARAFAAGRRLHDEGKVELGRKNDDEVEVRVWAPGRPKPPVVTLFPDDLEWDCDCPSREDACDHAVAAVLWWVAGDVTPVSDTSLRYLLSVRRGRLYIDREWLDADGTTRAVTEPLKTGAVQGAFSPSDGDLGIDRLIRVSEGMPPEVQAIPKLFEWLRGAAVKMDGASVTVLDEPIRPRGTLRRDGDGYTLRLYRDPSIIDVVADGVVRTEGGLAGITHVAWSGRQLEGLPAEKRYAAEAMGTLIGEVMPQLRAMGVTIEGDAPRTVRGLPVVPHVTARAVGPTLEVVARLGYGEPPRTVARIEHDRLVMVGEGGRWPERDPARERKAARGLASTTGLEPDVAMRATGAEALVLADRLRGAAVHIDARSQRTLAKFGGQLRARVDTGGSGTASGDAAWSLTFEHEGRTIDAAEVLRAWEDGASVFADEHGVAELPGPFLAEHADALAVFLAARKGDEVAAFAGPAMAELSEALNVPPPPSMVALRSLLSAEAVDSPERPADLTATLRPYQESGVDWMSLLADAQLGAMLCDDMGLGKTLQALTALRTPALVVCPTSVLANWREEARKFRPGLEVCVYHGRDRTLDPAAELTLTTYGVLRLDIEALSERRWAMVVLDEAQTIKNPDAKVARAAFELQADTRVTLSGTPVENRLEELWSQAHFCNPGLLGSREDFADLWARPIAAGDEQRAERLRKRIRPFLLRRTKQEVAPELPPRTEVTIHCELSEPERTLYDALLATTRDEVAAMLREGGSVVSALERLLRLRQAACHPGLVPGQDAGSSAKIARLMAELQTLVPAGHRALVFSQWTSLLDRVEPHLDAAGIGFTRLDGSTRDRGAVVDAFSAEDGPPVMLISLKAGGTGLNLTAADHVYFLDPWWNPAAERQAADRAHRIGQTRPVTVRRLVARDTVDERILALQEKKRGLADAVVAAGQGAGLDRAELLALLA